MIFPRSSGILMHLTSLPGTPGIGTLGNCAYAFVDWLASAHQSLWQMLPIGPTGYGDSPYASFSTYAGNPLLIDLDMLAEKGWMEKASAVPPGYITSAGQVNYGSVVWWKLPVLKAAAVYFLKDADTASLDMYKIFANDNASWLNHFASFMTIKEYYDAEAQKTQTNGIWYAFWPKALRSCSSSAVAEWDACHQQEIACIKVIQFFFYFQWTALKSYAGTKGISLIGDIPIFVAQDSADVWSNQNLFQLDTDGVPKSVAGVPPDYFSATGQLWGNPLYDWDAMKKTGYAWWVERIRHMLTLVDYVRIDHFRGFEAYWAVPFGEKTAVNGRWLPGPGKALFEAVKEGTRSELPVIAEDLGLITKKVQELRDSCGFPGMKVLQFAFSTQEAAENGMINAFLPHMYIPDCVVYTGTHDNETLQGWLEHASPAQVMLIASYLYAAPVTEMEIHELVQSYKLCRKLVTAALASTARFAVVPMQDICALGDDARMNTPATTGANWAWRADCKCFTKESAQSLAYISDLYGRNIKTKRQGEI